jgi:hypothetical protein
MLEMLETPTLETATAERYPDTLLPVFEKSMTTEYASLTKSGQPITIPVTPYVSDDGRTLDISTGVTYPTKAERARVNPKVALSYSYHMGLGIADAPTVLVYGLATVKDADLQANTDRYVRESLRKVTDAYSALPKFILKQMPWYFARVWVCVTPVRILWWPKSDLNTMPEEWHAPEGTVAPKSDPAPQGKELGQWMEQPDDWREGAAYAVDKLGAPVLTVVDEQGWPVPMRALNVRLTPEGFELTMGKGMPLVPHGKAFVTFHSHPERFTGQENLMFVGKVSVDGTTAHVKVERRTGDWSLKGNLITKTLGFMSKGRALRPRLEAEAQRRGQRVPVINLP